jgi:anti-sigma-K factor RskA
MMRIDCDVVLDNLDAYAIGALDADEVPAFEAHLAACPECVALLEEARQGAAAIALTVPIVPGSAALKARVMASAAVLSSEQRTPRPIRRMSRARLWPLAAAAMLVLSIGALSWGVVMQRQADDLRDGRDAAAASATQAQSQLASLTAWQDGMLTISAQSDAERTDLVSTSLAPSAHGTYIWSASDRMGAFLGTGMPPLPAGETYQFWFVYGAKWESAGTCAPGADGRAHLIVHRDETGENNGPVRGFAVTVERTGGSATPSRSGAMVLQSTLN